MHIDALNPWFVLVVVVGFCNKCFRFTETLDRCRLLTSCDVLIHVCFLVVDLGVQRKSFRFVTEVR